MKRWKLDRDRALAVIGNGGMVLGVTFANVSGALER
ncbi:hypothetical protein QO004_000446 [Rhizobium mesoamericanum]|nr:DUF1515 family protein [Rhizobium mesoamericanum]MDQ0558671.1 hypothetical protein [Rhizobium mesoamericanum]